MMNKYKSAGFLALLGLGFGWSLPAAAQQPGWGGNNKLEDAEIVVEKNRVNELPEANRNYEKFKIAPPEKTPQKVVYRFADYKLSDLQVTPTVRVLTIKQEELSRLYGNYVKLGFGNYGTPYLKGYFHNKRSSQMSYGADVSHVSSSKGPVPNSGVSNTELNLNGEMYDQDITLGGRISYGRDRYNFYGHKAPELGVTDPDTIKQIFNRIGAVGYINNKMATKSQLQYQASLGFDYLNDHYDARELDIRLGLGSFYKLDDNAGIKLDGDLSFVSHKDQATVKRSYVRFKPSYERDTDLFHLTLGATIGVTGDTVNNARKFNLYPNVRMAYELVDDKLQVFGGVSGDLERVTLSQLTRENPYLNQNVAVADINKVLDVFGGVTGNLGRDVKFTGRVAYQSFRNLYFFNNSAADSSKFDLVYDNGTTKAVNFFGDLSFNRSERFRLGLKGDYNAYTTDGLAEPFHRPAFQANVYGSYNVQDKIFFHSELYYISSTFGQIVRPNGDVLLRATDNIVDLNLKVDYRFSDKFSTFVMGNNLLGSKYQRFVNYHQKGLQAIVGLSYTF
ncbi:MAG: hypothetical protein ACO1NZ_12860 [Adhaeribacter sp.]